jgi:crotonobetainyl-CoA:carnitine CoA-transferase CaiB-like acyl-CoA transferase
MDIVVENFMPGTLERWGLGYDVLKQVKPDLILVRVTAYGQTGPYSDRPGFARVAHAFAGLSILAGEPDGRPVTPGSTSLGDYVTGMYAALGALLCYIAREKFGIGQEVDIALYEGVFRMLDELAPVYAKTGFIRERLGADTVNLVPHSHYRTADGKWVALACSNDEMWRRLAGAMGREDMASPETFGPVTKRLAARGHINAVVSDFIGSTSRDDLMALCLKHEVPLGPLNNIADIFCDPHYAARQNLQEIDVSKEGKITIPGVIPKLSETPGDIRSAGPEMGAHNEEIYLGRLGLSREQYEAYQKLGVI